MNTVVAAHETLFATHATYHGIAISADHWPLGQIQLLDAVPRVWVACLCEAGPIATHGS